MSAGGVTGVAGALELPGDAIGWSWSEDAAAGLPGSEFPASGAVAGP